MDPFNQRNNTGKAMTFKSGRGEKKNKGGGMPKIQDERFRRINLTVRVPRWLLDWLNNKRYGKISREIEEAVRGWNNLKPPE